jgi:hypothetical protein
MDAVSSEEPLKVSSELTASIFMVEELQTSWVMAVSNIFDTHKRFGDPCYIHFQGSLHSLTKYLTLI